MENSWPHGVTTLDDMYQFSRKLFGKEHVIENLLKDTDFDVPSGCFLIRVKGACKQDDWVEWPGLIDEAMKETMDVWGEKTVVEVRAKSSGQGKIRQYDSLQVTPSPCNCRVSFGGDSHQAKLESGSSANAATSRMATRLIEKFWPTTEKWHEKELGYHTKAFHLVLNRYQRNDGIEDHQDHSKTYDPKNPITSLSYGRGSILRITDKKKGTKKSLLLPIPR